MSVIQTYLVYALAILLAISIGINVIYHFDRVALKSTNTTLVNKNQLLADQVKTDVATIKDQNAKIDAAAKQTKDNDKKISDLGEKLADQADKNKELIDKLKNQPAPKTCDDAVKYLKDNLEQYQW